MAHPVDVEPLDDDAPLGVRPSLPTMTVNKLHSTGGRAEAVQVAPLVHNRCRIRTVYDRVMRAVPDRQRRALAVVIRCGQRSGDELAARGAPCPRILSRASGRVLALANGKPAMTAPPANNSG